MFRKVISMMDLNLARQLKYKLANSSSFNASKVASLQCTDNKSTTNRLHHRFVSKITCFKQCILRKKFIMYQCLNKVAVLQCTACNFMELDLDLSEEALKILMYLQENLLSGRFYLVTLQIQNVSLQFYWKRILPQIISGMGPARQLFLKFRIFISEKSLLFFFSE